MNLLNEQERQILEQFNSKLSQCQQKSQDNNKRYDLPFSQKYSDFISSNKPASEARNQNIDNAKQAGLRQQQQPNRYEDEQEA